MKVNFKGAQQVEWKKKSMKAMDILTESKCLWIESKIVNMWTDLKLK